MADKLMTRWNELYREAKAGLDETTVQFLEELRKALAGFPDDVIEPALILLLQYRRPRRKPKTKDAV